jgi:hypothetical protein
MRVEVPLLPLVTTLGEACRVMEFGVTAVIATSRLSLDVGAAASCTSIVAIPANDVVRVALAVPAATGTESHVVPPFQTPIVDEKKTLAAEGAVTVTRRL